jgi:hypothetical protein
MTAIAKSYNQLIDNLNFSYFGLISMTILIGSILGGITAMTILQNDAPIWELILCMSVAMTNNVVAIGQAPTRWIFNLFVLETIVCTLLIIVNLA